MIWSKTTIQVWSAFKVNLAEIFSFNIFCWPQVRGRIKLFPGYTPAPTRSISKAGFITCLLAFPCCKQMPRFPSETCCFYAKAATQQCLSFLPPASHRRGTTTNFPFSPKASSRNIAEAKWLHEEKRRTTVKVWLFFFLKDVLTPVVNAGTF